MPRILKSADLSTTHRQSTKPGQHSIVLERLEKRFELFWKTHPKGARVPHELKAAVIAALEQGVEPTALRRICGLSNFQVRSWQKIDLAKQKPRSEDLRVFSVVDEAPVSRQESEEVPTTEQELELRIGAWSVSVRLAGPSARRV